jgi:hypothetical protein
MASHERPGVGRQPRRLPHPVVLFPRAPPKPLFAAMHTSLPRRVNCEVVRVTAAYPLEADNLLALHILGDGPGADVGIPYSITVVCGSEEQRRNAMSERVRSLEVNDQFELWIDCKRLVGGRVAGLAPELLTQLPLGNAECAARDGNRPAQPGFFADNRLGFTTVEESGCEDVGVVEIFNKGIGDALLTG